MKPTRFSQLVLRGRGHGQPVRPRLYTTAACEEGLLKRGSPSEVCEARSSPTGRGLFAKRDFQAGDMIFRETATLDSVSTAAAFVKSFGPRAKGSEPEPIMGLVANFVEASRRKVLKALAPGTPPLLDGFFRPSDAAPGLEQYDEFAKEIHAALIEDVREKVAVEAVIDLLRVTRHNAHNVFVPMPSSLWREGSVGLGLFWWSSLCNHSCAPNASFSAEAPSDPDRASGLAMSAVRPIAAGTEICISYADNDDLLGESLFQRRKDLQDSFGFKCSCDRCGQEERDWSQRAGSQT